MKELLPKMIDLTKKTDLGQIFSIHFKKVCRKCGEEKPLDNFNRRRKSAFMKRNMPDGRRNICRVCANHYQRMYKAEMRKETSESY